MDTPVDVPTRISLLFRAVARYEPGGGGTSAVARDTGLPRPTVHRLLHALERHGLVEREGDSGRWLLGPEFYLLGIAAAPRYDVTEIAGPYVRRLATATGESAFFSVRRGNETICLRGEDGVFPIRSHVLFEGARFPLGVVSAGMVILAHLPAPEIEEYLRRAELDRKYGPQHTADEVRRHIGLTRHHGYSVNPGLVVEGSWGMAAAVFDGKGEPKWALTLTGVAHRFSEERRPALGGLLLREAHDLRQEIGRRQPSRVTRVTPHG